jgi:branched-chain amino acid aminotransferase
MSHFIVLDGKVLEKNEVNLTPLLLNGPFVISQKFWFGYGGIPLFTENIGLLTRQMEILQLPFPEMLKNGQELFRLTKRMLNKNKFYRSGHVLLQIFIDGEEPLVMVTSEASDQFRVPFQENGIFLNFAPIKKQAPPELSRFPFFNRPFWKAAGAGLRGSIFQNSVLLNENNQVCECIGANLFMMKGNTLITPALETGCYDDLLRNLILEIAGELKIKVLESYKISKEEMLNMNEIFIVSEESGMQWILGIENKRFVHHFSEIFYEQLDQRLKNKIN